MKEIYKAVGNMPPLPETVAQVQEACKNDETTIGDLVEIIGKDPMLSANILKAANSPIYGLSKEIKSLPQAVSLFGMSTIQGLTMSYGAKKALDIEPAAYGITKKQLTDVGMMQSSLATTWVKMLDKSLLDDISVVSLLSDLGKLAISQVLADKDSSALKEASSFLQVRNAEKELVNATTEEVSAIMFDQWNFNDTTISVLNFFAGVDKEVSPQVKKLAVILMVVKTCVNIKEQYTEKSIANALKLAQKYKLGGLQECIEELQQAAE